MYNDCGDFRVILTRREWLIDVWVSFVVLGEAMCVIVRCHGEKMFFSILRIIIKWACEALLLGACSVFITTRGECNNCTGIYSRSSRTDVLITSHASKER